MRNIITENSTFYIHKEIWSNIKEYKDDYIQVMNQREAMRIPFFHQSPQISYRSQLVQHVRQICIDKQLTHSCLHLTIYLMDIFMDNHFIVPERLLIMANVCLLLAAKFEENSYHIVRMNELNATINYKYPLKDYRNLECVILRFFDWYIMFPTAAHYVHLYMKSAINYNESDGDRRSLRTLIYNFHESVVDYLNQVIESVHYMQCCQPSKLAAAIIAASRIKMGRCSWTAHLKEMTGYDIEDIQETLMSLIIKKNNVYCIKCNKDNKDNKINLSRDF